MARILHHPPPRDVGCTIFEGANLVEEERVWRRHQRENPHSFVDTRRLFISVFVCFSVFCVLCFLCFFFKSVVCFVPGTEGWETRWGRSSFTDCSVPGQKRKWLASDEKDCALVCRLPRAVRRPPYEKREGSWCTCQSPECRNASVLECVELFFVRGVGIWVTLLKYWVQSESTWSVGFFFE